MNTFKVPGMCLGLSLIIVASAQAITWQPPETVDDPVADISSSTGASAVWFAGDWHLIYAKDGAISYSWRDAAGWHGRVLLAAAGSSARNPHLAATGGSLVAVWEAKAGFDHPEVFCRRGSFNSWTSPEILSGTTVTSRSPVVAADPSYATAIVAWEDSTATGWRVYDRVFTGSWGGVESVNTGGADARDPSVSMDYGTFIAWADFRGGAPQIYLRERSGSSWGPEEQRTSLAQGCRSPNVCSVYWDTGPAVPVIVFEAMGTHGVTETWASMRGCTNGVFPVSQDDAIPSVQPGLSVFFFETMTCPNIPYGGLKSYASWTDQSAPGSDLPLTRQIGYCAPQGPAESLDVPGSAHSTYALHGDTPRAEAMQAWVERINGVSTLRARTGTMPGCHSEELLADSPILLSPGGVPVTRMRAVDVCSGEGVLAWIQVTFDSNLDQALTWAPGQSHPYLDAYTQADGTVAFAIRGGGCAQGTVTATAGMWCDLTWSGAKSPDVDGNCVVDPTDLAYVQARLGTTDFCADLDGSGRVGAEDVAMVQMALGDRCDGPSSADGEPVAAIASLDVRPNPCRGEVRLRLTGSGGASTGAPATEIRVLNAGGQIVRRLPADLTATGSAEWIWDLRDEHGQALPSGCYFAQAAAGQKALRAPILILR